VPLPPPNQHPAVAAPVEKGGYCKVCENKLKKVVQKYDCTGIEEDEGQTWQQVDGIDMHGLSTV
jgi:hypothetical protein